MKCAFFLHPCPLCPPFSLSSFSSQAMALSLTSLPVWHHFLFLSCEPPNGATATGQARAEGASRLQEAEQRLQATTSDLRARVAAAEKRLATEQHAAGEREQELRVRADSLLAEVRACQPCVHAIRACHACMPYVYARRAAFALAVGSWQLAKAGRRGADDELGSSQSVSARRDDTTLRACGGWQAGGTICGAGHVDVY